MQDLDQRLLAAGIKREEVDESFIRAGGKGGQNVNKLATCVVLVHRPTGIVVRSANERSQYRNRVVAWDLLLARLRERAQGLAAAARAAVEKTRRQERPRPRSLKEKILRHKKHVAEKKKERGRIRDY